jgi:serine/threonine protein kinase
MGVVYEAEEIESGRRVALKALGQALDSPEARQRFLREGLLAASINHPNVVYVFGTEEIDGQPVIVMELVGGGTLQDRVRPGRPMAVTEAVDAILQVIAGLEAAAVKGVLHRDIKPSNCFVETDGTIKVGDFGLSIPIDPEGSTRLTLTGSFMGTPAYSAPEQLRGDEFTLQGDIYAVGVTLYYLLTAKTPFEGENLVRMLATVLERPATSPAQLRPELPGGLCRAVLNCLEKQPARRFASYAELRKALLPYRSQAPARPR